MTKYDVNGNLTWVVPPHNTSCPHCGYHFSVKCTTTHVELPQSKWIRQFGYKPSLKVNDPALIAEDIDKVILRFTSNNRTGKLKLIEMKSNYDTTMKAGQWWTFGLLDWLLRQVPDYQKWYEGFFLVYSRSENWYRSDNQFAINDRGVSKEQLRDFINNTKLPSDVLPMNVGLVGKMRQELPNEWPNI